MAFEIGERVTSRFTGPGIVTGLLQKDEDGVALQPVRFDQIIMGGERLYPISRLQTLEPESESKSKPRAIHTPRSLKIRPTKESYSDFLEYLRTPEANCLLTLEAQCPEMDFAVRQQYEKLTGDQLKEGKGYNVAPPTAKKQGCEGSVTFVTPPVMPEDLAEMMTQRQGLINRVEVVWMLIENGFRVTR